MEFVLGAGEKKEFSLLERGCLSINVVASDTFLKR